jgi:hypothetical protein
LNINPVDQLVSLIQAQFARRPVGAGAKAAKPAEARPPRYAREGLAALIAARISAIEADDPQRRRKAFRVFLEAVLLSELGEELLKDPRFFALVDDVHRVMESDQATREMVEAATTKLLEQRG